MKRNLATINDCNVANINNFPITGCGSVVNNTLKSPGYRNNYPRNMDCSYTIPIPRNRTMNISFIDFHLEEGDDESSCE